NNLGYLYYHGGKNFPANPDKAETWYRKAIARGHVKAKCNLTDLMATRLPPNWQLKMVNAAKNGDIETIRQLLNRGAKPDAGQTAGNTPLAWAAKNKHLNAALLLAEREEADLSGLTKLGNLLYQGSDDFPANLPSAKYWYLKAARLGNVVAMASLGYLYMHGGEDFPANPHEAEHWSHKAATLGNVDAMNNLGYLYHHGGKNFPANPDKAKTWYQKAIARGHVKAKGNLTDLMATTPDGQRGKERR
ncbi:tetratricopeptide repeat protein, partial [Endozoicomonas sp. ONNA2]|uniref:tetratricopeptide repeat protein n=1 Tax=Endozoicomonas sp. ONNA2 TaxID=2828741 RepID=UPI0021478C7F